MRISALTALVGAPRTTSINGDKLLGARLKTLSE